MTAAITRLFLVALTLLALTAAIAATASKSPYSLFSGVYVKLLPGKELCLNYHAYRDSGVGAPLHRPPSR